MPSVSACRIKGGREGDVDFKSGKNISRTIKYIREIWMVMCFISLLINHSLRIISQSSTFASTAEYSHTTLRPISSSCMRSDMHTPNVLFIPYYVSPFPPIESRMKPTAARVKRGQPTNCMKNSKTYPIPKFVSLIPISQYPSLKY